MIAVSRFKLPARECRSPDGDMGDFSSHLTVTAGSKQGGTVSWGSTWE